MQEFLTLANSLADAAGEIAREHFRTPFDVISKDDASPVTIADRAIEQRMREMIEKARPDDGILGEEFGEKQGANGLTWVLDPIDGTKSFVIGRPTFGTLIALCDDGAPTLGVIDQPISEERWVGAEGRTVFNGAPVKTQACAHLKDARSASTTPAMFENLRDPHIYEAIEAKVKMMAWGGDCYMYGLMASGHLDLIFEASMNPYDYAALVPIVEGAGGFMSDFKGAPLTLDSDGTVLALGDKALLPNIIALLERT